jgi:two-component system response regulator
MRTAPHVLLVEDNPDDEEFTIRALRDAGLGNAIHVAHDGAQALEYLARCELPETAPEREVMPKLVLLDLKLPKLDGVDVLRQIKANAATVSVPVVVLTSSRQDRDIKQCYALGANSYVVKPVAFEQFAEAIQHVGRYWLRFNEPPFTEPGPLS